MVVKLAVTLLSVLFYIIMAVLYNMLSATLVVVIKRIALREIQRPVNLHEEQCNGGSVIAVM